MKRTLGLAWSSLLVLVLVLVVGCEEDDGYYDHHYDYDYYGGVIIGPADHYDHGHGHGDHGHGDHDHGGPDHGGPDHGGPDRGGNPRGDGNPGRGSGRSPGGGQVSPGGGYHNRGNSRIDYIEITGYRVRPIAGPVLDEFELTASDVQYQVTPFQVTSIGSCKFTARVTEEQINTFVNGRVRNDGTVRDIRFTFTPQQVQVTATVMLDGRQVTAVSTGILQPADKTRLVYVPGTMTEDGLPLPPAVQQELVQQLNPVVDLAGLNIATQIQQVTEEKGTTVLTGTAAPKKLP